MCQWPAFSPETRVTEAPAPLTNDARARIEFDSPSDPKATFECNLDSDSFTECASPATYATLADADHVFTVRARDTAGRADATPIEVRWQVACDEKSTADSTCFGACALSSDASPDYAHCDEGRLKMNCPTEYGERLLTFNQGKSCVELGYIVRCDDNLDVYVNQAGGMGCYYGCLFNTNYTPDTCAYLLP